MGADSAVARPDEGGATAARIAADKKVASQLASAGAPKGPARSDVTDPAEEIAGTRALEADAVVSKPTADAPASPDDPMDVDGDAPSAEKAPKPGKLKGSKGKSRMQAKKMGDDSADDEDSGADMDAEDNAPDPDDVKDAADPDGNQPKPKETRKVIGDGFVHYAADVYVQSSARPGTGHIDLTFQLYDAEGEYYPFKNCDATGHYHPVKDAPLLRSKIAVQRYLERDGMTPEDAERYAAEFQAREFVESIPIEVVPREAPPRRKAAANAAKYKDVSSDDDMSDLMEAGETAPLKPGDEGYESEEDEDKIEKILLALEPGDIDAAELETLGSDDAKAFAKLVLEGKWAPPTPKKKKPVKPKPKKQKRGKKAEPEEEEEAPLPPLLYCVKWEGCSHRRRSWETEGGVVDAKGKYKLNNFQRQYRVDPDSCQEGFHPDYLLIDRVIDEREAEDDDEDAGDSPASKRSDESASEKVEYLIKWRGLIYSDATWEAADWLKSEVDANEIRRFRLRNSIKDKRKVHAAAAERAKSGGKPPAKPKPPAFKNGMILRDYQVTSFEWMIGNYRRRTNVILGDEMGLGKTAQCISVMEHVRTEQLRAPRPFLVIAPLTTLGHWKREIEKWTDMNVVLMDGNAKDREIIESTEFWFPGKAPGKGPAKFDVLLVSFETARRLTELIASFEWAACVCDEAHKLKDVNSLTTKAVMEIGYDWLLLLTGTPIQNNVKELFGIMHVLDPEKYPSWEHFQESMLDGGGREVDAEQVMRLREVLKPRMLRRMKEDVEKIPAKEEIVVWVELTPEQRAYYRMIYEKQVHVLMEGNKSKNVPQLRNLCMELRKVCNHPFLCDGMEEDFANKKKRAVELAAEKAAKEAVEKGLEPPAPPAPPQPLDMITQSSGKMMLLNKLLPKLKAEGHKVLVFSQFAIVLDILSDYLDLMGYEHERLDGSTSQAARQAGIDRFNTPGKGFVYLLSTRAGGMGITLTAADTAIIYDSDWNPQNDLQAMARCHRIGQTKEVKVYRLVTKATYEQSLFETSSKKYGLDEAVLGGGEGGFGAGKAKEDAKKINELLKYGVHGALRDASGEEARAFAEEDIDSILHNRAEHRAIGSRAGNTFSTATFNVGDAKDIDVESEKFWEEMLPEAVKRREEEAANDAAWGVDARFRVQGPRKRAKIGMYKEGARGIGFGAFRRGEKGGDSENDYSSSESESDRETRAAKRRTKRAKVESERRDGWIDREIKAIEEALFTFGPGRNNDCVRAVKEARQSGSLEDNRTFSECKSVALALLDMVDGVGKICKESQDKSEAEDGRKGGKVERCAVCASSKKGRCGTETAPKSCLNLSDELRARMNAADEDADTAVPVGMTRATWDAVIACCEGVLNSHEDSLPPAAFSSLGRPCVYKRMSSGWARGTKAIKERNALAATIETPGYAPAPGSFDEMDGPEPPPEKDEFEFSEMMKPTSGGWSRWWSKECDAALLRGSLRYGFSPWSQADLEAQFECILKDKTLWFAMNDVVAPDEDEDKKADAEHSKRVKAANAVHEEAKKALNDENDKATHEAKLKERREMLEEANKIADEGPKRMPGRDTLKRRVLGLLKNLIDPPAKKELKVKLVKEPKPKKPTKAELAEIRKAERLARDQENAQKFKDSLTGGGNLKVAFKIPKNETAAAAAAVNEEAAAAAAVHDDTATQSHPKPKQDQGNGEAPAEISRHTSPAAGATTNDESAAPDENIDEPKIVDAFGALMTSKKGKLPKKEREPKKEKKPKKEKQPKKERAVADGENGDDAVKPKKRRKKKDASDAAGAGKVDDAGAEKIPAAAPEPEPEAEPEPEPELRIGVVAPPRDPSPTFERAAVAKPAVALDFGISEDDDPLTSCVLTSLNANANAAGNGNGGVRTPAGAAKPAGSSFLTPGSGTVRFGGNAGGFKKSGVGGVKSGLGPGQTSLFGFFKTPAPAADQERPRAVNTPTTGDFIAM